MPAAYCTLPDPAAKQHNLLRCSRALESITNARSPLHNLELKTQLLLSMRGLALQRSKTETQAAMRPHWILEV